MRVGLDDSDLQGLRDVLERGAAGLIVVYATDLAERIPVEIKAVNRYVSKAVDVSIDELTEEWELSKADKQPSGSGQTTAPT